MQARHPHIKGEGNAGTSPSHQGRVECRRVTLTSRERGMQALHPHIKGEWMQARHPSIEGEWNAGASPLPYVGEGQGEGEPGTEGRA